MGNLRPHRLSSTSHSTVDTLVTATGRKPHFILFYLYLQFLPTDEWQKSSWLILYPLAVVNQTCASSTVILFSRSYTACTAIKFCFLYTLISLLGVLASHVLLIIYQVEEATTKSIHFFSLLPFVIILASKRDAEKQRLHHPSERLLHQRFSPVGDVCYFPLCCLSISQNHHSVAFS